MNRRMVPVWDENPSHLGYCRSLLKEITCLIDHWDDAIGQYQVTKKEEEIINCENALFKVKDMIWNSCLLMFSKYNLHTKQRRGSQGAIMFSQPERTSSKTVNTNTEVIVHESNNLPIAVRQREATHTVLVSNSPHQQIVQNLLLEWCVYINPQFQLCLVGTLPNDGRWETSPISTRIGPTKVKTVSGTLYTMHGKMVLTEDAEIPDFVLEKFEDGFPMDWKAVTAKWISILKEKSHGVSITRSGATKNVEIEPQMRIRDTGKQRALTPSQVSQQNEKFLPPLPKDNNLRSDISTPNIIRKPAPASTASRVSPVLRPAHNQQNESLEEEEEEQQQQQQQQQQQPPPPIKRNVRKSVSAVVPRYSQRLLSKSLLDTTGVSEVHVSASKKAKAEKFLYLKDWGVDFGSDRDENLVLYGILVDEQGNALQKRHYSSAISHRVHADIVETVKGEHYRLVGPSILRSRDFDFGFPVHWRSLAQKLRKGGNVERQPSFTASTISLTGETRKRGRPKFMPQSSADNVEIKRHHSVISRTLKHQLSKAQSSMVDAVRNGVQNRTRNSSSVSKMSIDSVSLQSRKGAPLKRRKVMDEDQTHDQGRSQEETMANMSVGETVWKQGIIKTMQNFEKRKAEGRKTNAVEEDKTKEIEPDKSPAVKPTKTVIPVRKNCTVDKYVLGLATDDCQSEEEFNIF